MDLVQALILAIVQGITEFLPISSSAHLILPSQLLGWEDQGLAFDVAVHLGSLVAILGVLRKEVLAMLVGAWTSVTQRRMEPAFRLALLIVLATLPAVVTGLAFKDVIESSLRTVVVIATTTLLFGLLLGFADLRARRSPGAEPPKRPDERAGQGAGEGIEAMARIGVGTALFIGLAQCLALIPGTSRSGITMTAGLLAGLSRTSCARFSFLLAIPTIAGAATLSLADLLTTTAPVDWLALGTGFVASAVSAALCVQLFLGAVERIGFMPFVAYRIALGIALFALWV